MPLDLNDEAAVDAYLASHTPDGQPIAAPQSEPTVTPSMVQPAPPPVPDPREEKRTFFQGVKDNIIKAGQLATGVSQELGQGVKSFATSAELSYRQISDYLGLTSPEITAQRYKDMKKDEAVADQSFKSLTGSDAGSIVRGVGSMAAGIAAFGGGALGVGQKALGTGLKGSSILGGSTSAAMEAVNYNPNDTAADKLTNVGLAGAIGTGIGATPSLLGIGINGVSKGVNAFTQGLKRRFAGEVHPEKLRAFKEFNFPYSAEQVIGEDQVGATYGALENVLAHIPGWAGGTSSKLARTQIDAKLMTKTVIDELAANVKANPAGPLYEKVKAATQNMRFKDISSIKNTAASAYESVASELKTNLSERTSTILQETANLPSMTFNQLWLKRQNLDDEMADLLRSGLRGWSKEYSALGAVRKEMSNQLSAMAKFAGAGKIWDKANKLNMENIAQNNYVIAYPRSFKGNRIGNPDVNDPELAKWLPTLYETAMNRAALANKKLNVALPAGKLRDRQTAIMQLHNIFMNSAVQPKHISAKLSAGATAAGAGVVAHSLGVPLAPAAAVAALLTKGASALVYTESGIKLLEKIGHQINKLPKMSPDKYREAILKLPAVRAGLLTMAAVGQVDQIKSPEFADAEFSSNMIPDWRNMSEEEADAIIQKHEGQP